MSKYEAHITFPGSMWEGVKREVDGWAGDEGWKFSRMVGDPILGDGEHCYMTTHDIDSGYLSQRIWDMVEQMRDFGFPPLRAKIELDVMDERY